MNSSELYPEKVVGAVPIAETSVNILTASIDMFWNNPVEAKGAKIIIRNFRSESSAVPLIRGSIDGATFKLGATDYAWYANIINTATQDTSDSEIQLAVDSLLVENGQIIIHVAFPRFAGDTINFVADLARSSHRREQSGGELAYDSPLRGISLFMASGGIERADIEVYTI